MKSGRLLSLLCVGALSAGTLVAGVAVAVPEANAATTVQITPNPSYAAEEFEGWGTSLVWFANATGGYPADVRQALFDAVFGEEGLNLNIARYNIGGGNATDVPHYLRPGGAVPGWWNPDLGKSDAEGEITSTYADRERYAAAWDANDPSSYDFDADQSQRWWLDALKDKVTKWEAFSNSPPYFLTESGFVSGGINNATSEQLAPENMDDFASYLVTVVEELEEEHGIEFDTLDPFNEPNTDYWQTRIPEGQTWPTTASRQEGAHIGPAAQDQMIQALAERLSTAKTDVDISAMDETNPSLFARNWAGWSDASKGEVDQLNVHTYGTGDRLVARDIAKAADKPLWMSEVEGDWDGTGFNLVNIENGLGMAGRIVDDLRELEPSAWVFWQPVEDLYNMEKVENLNWGSVFIDFDCNADGDSERRIADGEADPSCEVQTNAKFNTVRNFTHYIHPGDKLIPTNDTQTTAALTAAGDGVTLVHVNSESTERTVQLDLSGFGEIAPGATVTPIVTTQSPASDVTANALVEGQPVVVDAASKSATLTLPAKSVSTLVVSGVSGVSDEVAAFEDGETYQLLGVQSGKALAADATGLSIRSGATEAGAGRAQAWTVESLSGEGTNRHRIALRNGDGRYLAVAGTGTTLVAGETADPRNDPNLQWIPSTTDGRTFALLSVAAERVLDVNGQSSVDGTSVGTWTSNNGANQRWTPTSTKVVEIAPVAVSTAVGEAPQLPATVTVRYGGGVERSAPVVWDAEGIDWTSPGSVEVSGSGTDIFGAPFTGARATVEVGAYTGTQPVSLTTYAGASLERVRAAAPATVPAEVRVGGTGYDTPVQWDWSAVTDADFAEPGTVVVPGSATSNAGGSLSAQLTVIVTEPGERNVAPESRPSATFTESASYGVERTINGSTTDKGWSNWRSGTKNTQDTLTYTLAETTDVGRVAVHFYRDGGATWAQSLRVEHRTAGGEWVAGETVTVPETAAGAPVVDIPLGGVTADEVRVVLVARSNTHMIVSEVEIYGPAAGVADIADLARLTVGDQVVPEFDPQREQYTVRSGGAAWPVLAAIPVDRAAEVAIAQPGDVGGAGTVTVTAPSGASRTYQVFVEREVDLAQPAIVGTAQAGATVSAEVGTVDPAGAALTFAWTRNEQPIVGATGATYAVTDADVAQQLRVVVTAAAEGFVSATATSEPVVAGAAPSQPGVPTEPGQPGDQPDAPGAEPGRQPSAPADSALTDALKGWITAPATITAGSTITIGVGDAWVGQSVSAWLLSEPVLLGTRAVSLAGEMSVPVPADAPLGAHRLAVTDASGAVLGWVSVTVVAPGGLAATGGELSGTMVPLGLGVLGAGALLLVAVRQRRRLHAAE